MPNCTGSSNPIHVLVLTDCYLPHAGGSRFYYHNVYTRFAPDRATVLTTKVPGWQEFDRQESSPAYRIVRRLQPLPNMRWQQFPKVAMAFGSAVAAFAASSCDLIHVGDLFPQGLFAPVFRYCGRRPYIAYCHGEDITLTAGYRFQPRLRNLVFRRAAAVIANAEFACTNLRAIGVAADRIHKITPGVDLQRFSPRPRRSDLVARWGLENQAVLVTVGRLVPRKGQDVVIRALARLLSSIPDLKYVIVGSGPDRERLQHLAQECNVAERVVFAGTVMDDELADYYALADVMVLPNRQETSGDLEGFGMVFVEANAVGCPVVGGRSGGAAEAVADGRTGVLLADPTSPEELASVLTSLLGNPDLRQRMGQAGAIRARNEFGWESRAEAIRLLSREVVRSAHPAVARGR